MKDNKHIDRVFQEKLKDFEVTPDPSVWDAIESSLNKKDKDRKIIPFWWKSGGVAAALLLALLLGNLIFNDSSNNPTTPTFVDTEKKDVNPSEKQEVNTSTVVDSDEENVSDSNKADNNKTIINKEETTKSALGNSNSQTKNDALANRNNQKPTHSANSSNAIINQPKRITVFEDIQKTSNKTKNTDTEIDAGLLEEKERYAENKSETENPLQNNKAGDDINDNTEEQVIVENKEEDEKTPLTEDLVLNEENIDEKEKKVINRWQITPNIAPVYFNSLGKGSSIDKQLVNNKKTGDINMSYGVNVSYAINDKLSVRSGVSKVNLGYSTNDIVVYEHAETTTLASIFNSNSYFRNVKLNPTASGFSILNGDNFSFAQSPSITNESMTFLNQYMSFYEIPLELKYHVSNKKLGMSFIGGFSTLLLSDNKISYENNGLYLVLGEATNINNTSFSANFGLGLDYGITKSINLNLNPMFKYQLNTFNNTSGDFNPYFIGVYSGISIKF